MGQCCMAWISVSLFPTKSVCWKSNAHSGNVRSWGLWEAMSHGGGALMSGVSALTEEPLNASSPLLPPQGDTRNICHWGERPHVTVLAPWPWTSSPQNCEKCVAFKTPRLWCYVVAAQMDSKKGNVWGLAGHLLSLSHILLCLHNPLKIHMLFLALGLIKNNWITPRD